MFDVGIFVKIYSLGIFLVVLQGICAAIDGYFTQGQMRTQGIVNGYSFLEQGAMWADILIISPGVAYYLAKYRFDYSNWWVWVILALAIAVTAGGHHEFNRVGLEHPVAHNHDGHATIAGWIHYGFMVAVLFIGGMVYLTHLSPALSKTDLLVTSTVLVGFFFLGQYDFNKEWHWEMGAKKLFAVEVAGVWITALVRLTNL